jgi:hypothetical protein
MAAVWRLVPVAARLGRRDALGDQLVGVPVDRLHSAQLHERAFAAAEVNAGPDGSSRPDRR